MRATIIIPVFNAWTFTEACLASLIPTLRKGDNVIVVDNGSSDQTHAELLALDYDWLSWIYFDENQGFAVACNSGASSLWVRESDALVFLNNDTIVYSGWLDELLIPLEDEGVGAVGAISNFVSGPQLVGHDAVPSGQSWRADDPNEIDSRGLERYYTRTDRLVGFCLATRTETFKELGGFSEDYGLGGYEDDDYCQKVLAAGLELLIAHSCFVYHHGHATFEANGLDPQALQDEAKVTFTARWGD